MDMHKSTGMIKGTMNTPTNLFVLLIVISFIFPATAIRYAQAASTTPAESTENNATSSNESTENNATSPANMTDITCELTMLLRNGATRLLKNNQIWTIL
jgi:hypothetical protein